MTHIKAFSKLALMSLALATHSSAQVASALVGSVRDPSGGGISGALVMATRVETGITYRSQTTSAGDYFFQDIPVGTYSLLFRAPGFRTLPILGIRTEVASVLRQDAGLELASLSQSVEVQSSTPLVKNRHGGNWAAHRWPPDCAVTAEWAGRILIADTFRRSGDRSQCGCSVHQRRTTHSGRGACRIHRVPC